jgi:glycosyltransferase involved in cell wall biosynthesis
MRIGILSQYYPPETGAPQARLSDLAKRFVSRGHDVTVLTAMPNYPRGKVFPGYGGLLRRERLDGVSVARTWIYPTQSVGFVKRLWNYFSFVLSSLLAGPFVFGKLDYLITESPPLFLGIAGFVLSRIARARWIFNVSDLWPESAVRLGVLREGLGLRAAEALEAFCYRHAWLVTGQSREILEDIRRRFPSVPTYHLSNGVDTEMFSPDKRSAEVRRDLLGGRDDAACLAVYAGLHGIAQGLDQVLDAATLVRHGPLRIVLIGDGPEKARLERHSRELRLSNLRFLDTRTREAMPELMASADVAIVPLKLPLPGAVPSKLYEAMGAGAAVVLVADGEAASVVRESGAGVVVTPGDVRGLAGALEKLAADAELRGELGRAGRSAVLDRFDRKTIAARFIGHLEERTAC